MLTKLAADGSLLLMTTTKKSAALVIAALLAFSGAACGNKSNNDDVTTTECDPGDQREHDSDCGYIDDNGNWIWYSWVIQGQTRTGPAPYAEAEGEEGNHSKLKKTKKPTSKPTSKIKTTKPSTAKKK